MTLSRIFLLPAALCVAGGSWTAAAQEKPAEASAAETEAQGSTGQLGSLNCSRIAGSGYNFLITSKAEVRCIFSGQGESEQWYKGETGVGFGVDLKWNKVQTIRYGVLSSTTKYTPEGDFLDGRYGGAKAEASVGVGLGAAVLVGGSNDTLSLQPAFETSQGAGIAAGISYLNLASDPLSLARIAIPVGGLMSQALYSAYFVQALHYYRAPLYAGSDRFSDKALNAAAAQTVRPEDVWDGAPAELVAGRERLVASLNEPLSFEAPGTLARAQVSFDCWAYGLANEVAAEDVEACHAAFETGIAGVEAVVADARARAERIATVLQPRWFTVYFGTDVATLEPAALKMVADAVAATGDLEDARVFVGGNTDRSGSAAYNQQLSEKRALTVRAALVDAGVPEGWLTLGAFGQENPVSVGTNPHDALNRRVDVTIQPLVAKPQ